MWFGSAYSYWITEISGPETTRTADTMLFGAQVGARLPIGASTLTLAAHYYDLAAGQGRSPFYASNANGNTTFSVTSGTPPVTTIFLTNDYEVAELAGQFDTTLGALPVQVWADYAQNRAVDDLDTAWAAGVLFGKASNPKTWEFGFAYESLEKDALFAQLVDSDFAGGATDAKGWVVRGAYAPQRNWTLNATYFINQRNVDVPASSGQTEIDYNRLQLDFNVKF
jgi:hypothetical protein